MEAPRRVRVSVDRNKCVGSTMCLQFAPTVFALNEGRQSIVTDPDGDSAEHILEAAESCPLSAITVNDAETGERVFP